MEFAGGTSKSPAAQGAALRSCFMGRPPNLRQNLAPKTPRSPCHTLRIRRSHTSSWKAKCAVLLDCRLLNNLTMPAVQTAVLPGSQVDRSRRALLFGVALTSFSALLLELALTRLFSVVLARESRHIPRIYGADLAGGATACLAVVPLLNWIGGPNTVLFAGVMTAVASAIWAASSIARKTAGALSMALLLVITANH